MRKAWRLVMAFGIVSLFGDMVYEGARGIIPSYLKLIGLSSALVGTALGIAEFLAYAFRIFGGYIADRTEKHRALIFLGYGLIALLPAIALVYDRRIALLFIFLERFGKAIRAPARDAILADATKELGRGKAFGVHEAMDQIGAALGPLLVALVLLSHDIREALLVLFVPYLFIVAALLYAKSVHPSPGIPKPTGFSLRPLHVAIFFNASALFLPFMLLYAITGGVELFMVPLVYLYLNAVDAVASLIAGKLYDSVGKAVPAVAFLLTPLPIAFYVYSRNFCVPRYFRSATFIGIVYGLWESVFRAYVADTAKHGLASEYGAYYTMLGLGLAVSGSVYGYLLGSRLLLPYSIVLSAIGLALFLSE